jgi:tetratricopeptide (TPR) repeat protein
VAVKREQVVQTAEKYVSRGRIEAAIKEYRKLLADNPNDINTLNRVGDLYARIQRIDEAVDFFVQIAEQYTAEGFFPKATAIYKKIIKLDPTRLDIYERLAELYGRQGLVTEARSQYQVLADYYQKHENAASAIGIYQKLAQLEPENPTYHVKLAEIYQAQKLIEKALGEYRTIAEMMIAAGHAQEAAQVYERALDLDSGNIPFITEAVLKLREAGLVGAAARLLSVAVERNPQAERVARLVGMGETHPVAIPPEQGEETWPTELRAAEAGALETAAPATDEEDTAETPLALPEEFALEPHPPRTEPAAPPPTAATPRAGAPAAPAGEFDELTLDLDEVFVLDLEDDRMPSSQVAPPPDMVDEAARRPSWSAAADLAAPAAAPPPAPAPTLAAPPPVPPLAAAPPAPAPPPAMPPPGALAAGPIGGLTADEAAALEESLLDFDLGAIEELPPLDLPAPPPAAAAAAGGALDEELELGSVADFELELEDLPELAELELAEEPPPAAGPPAVGSMATAEPAPAPAAPPPHAATPRPRDEDLVTEAEVLAKYGLQEKALERLREVLRANPRHLEAHALLVTLHLDQGRHAKAMELANVMGRVAAKAGSPDVWQRVKRRLVAAGYRLDGERVAAPPRERPAARDEVAQLIEGLLEPGAKPRQAAAKGKPAPAKPRPAAAADLAAAEPPGGAPAAGKPAPAKTRPRAVADRLAELVRGRGAPAKPRPAAAADLTAAEPPPAAASAAPSAAPPQVVPPAPAAPRATAPPLPPARSGKIDLRQIGREIAAEEFGEIAELLDAASPPDIPPPGPPRRRPDAILDETGGMSWLDEADARRSAGGGAAGGGEELFGEEEGFIDFAAELKQELSQAGIFEGEMLLQPREQSLEEIVEGFKRGVAENLSPTDYETHFNLGIAYREMGLLDEAIGEFQLAAKSPDHLVSCCSMLGLCFLDKGLPELAIKWYRRGLAAPNVAEDDALGLLYDLGNVQMSLGEPEEAYKTFVELYGINTNYRDVVAKLEELGHRSN